ncbi:hypothetical protein [Geitlerinema sp. PCC 7407]|uniref:hypothetical protein n=1 Tax=Geitlerinema sp. PCC 7407 TaxID=1173025 RepID=UPI00029FB846|nr:hypothetical protein [Geitlerinema sp. PCC 7407]AFY66971.1 hypothetical protein GEI7407_2496 [Geitlerinema sp. PCC 7407]
MFIIDIAVKYTPLPLSVQRKSQEDAHQLYQHVLDAIQSGQPKLLELTCEHQTDKRLAIVTSEISAVQLTEKSGSSASGRPAGFFAIAE